MDLFITPAEEFAKASSSEVLLPDDPNAWPQEILQELFKQVPFVADFSPEVVMDRVDAEKGYGFGVVEVMNQTEMQAGQAPAQLAAAGVRQARIPIIVTEGKLQPFDILVTSDSSVVPLTEERLRSAIFRPQLFDTAKKEPGPASMAAQLYPPMRDGDMGGLGGGTWGKNASSREILEQTILGGSTEKTAGVMDDYFASKDRHGRLGKEMQTVDARSGALGEFIAKHASADCSLLEAILPTITVTDHGRFLEFVQNERHQALLLKNAAAVAPSVKRILDTVPETVEKRASALPHFIQPTVVQIVRDAGVYTVKTASHVYWSPTSEKVGRGEVIKRFGEKTALAADLSGAVTLAEGADAQVEPEVSVGGPISEPGFYKVHTDEGQELVGYVLPNIIDTDGTEMPLAMFVNGSQSAVQSDIEGLPTEVDDFELPTGAPTGTGFFFSVEGDTLKATIPMTLKGSFSGPGELPSFQAETFDGRSVLVSQQPNIQQVVGSDEKMLIPEGWQWCPSGQGEAVSLASAEDTAAKEASKHASSTVDIISSSARTFSFRGAPVVKLAYSEREFLDLDQAMFLLAGLGVHPGFGAQKLAEATVSLEPVGVRIGRELHLAREVQEESRKLASASLSTLPMLKRNLWKEASVISDPSAVDTVLSLGFLNPENLLTFVGYLPSLDDAQTKLCELLLAVRLGQQEIPAYALETAIRSLEEVLVGLKVLAFRQN